MTPTLLTPLARARRAARAVATLRRWAERATARAPAAVTVGDAHQVTLWLYIRGHVADALRRVARWVREGR
jgi:hypothetical protein